MSGKEQAEIKEIRQSPNPADLKRRELAEILPEAFSEGRLDVQALKRALGEDFVVEEGERYRLEWAGKRDAYRVLQTPTTATLRPQRDKSVNFDTAEHVFIEGENLEVLKVLQKAYFGKVKMIYIDPPYNTGNDSFVYPDRFQESKEEYLKRINELTDDGTLMREGFFRKNSRDNGHYHSNWLSMMLPRLYLARNLLRDDGVIFVSCDDNEVHNLRCLMNEIFGEENWIAQITWEKGRKNDSTFFSESVEYMHVFCKSRDLLASHGQWRGKKQGVDEVLSEYRKLRSKYGNDHNAIVNAMTEFYGSLERGHPARQLSHFWRSDDRGLYFGGDISSASTSIPDYDVIHPVTGKPVKKPTRGWGCTEDVMRKRIAEGRVHFGSDETTIPLRKVYLEEADSIVKTPVIYKDGRAATRVVNNLFGAKIFDNPKDHYVLMELFEYAGLGRDDIVLDFFAGSATTAHAVIEMNKQDGGRRRSLLVQMPELTDSESIAHKLGYKTIADIGRERIRKVIDLTTKNDLVNSSTNTLGMKYFSLSPSCFRQWRGDEVESEERLLEQIKMFIHSEKEGADKEAILYELLLKFGQELTTRMETLSVKGERVFAIHERQMLFVLENFTEPMIEGLLALKPREVIALDSVFHDSDELKTNFDLQCRDADVKFTCI